MKYGLVPSMASGGGGSIASAPNRTENHAKIEESIRALIDREQWLARIVFSKS